MLSISEETLAFIAFTAKQWSTPFSEEADMVAGKCREFSMAILTTADDVFTFLQEIHEKHSPAENDAMQVILSTLLFRWTQVQKKGPLQTPLPLNFFLFPISENVEKQILQRGNFEKISFLPF